MKKHISVSNLGKGNSQGKLFKINRKFLNLNTQFLKCQGDTLIYWFGKE